MNESLSQPARHTIEGTLWVLLCEALALPAGLLVVIFLTRRLGPAGFGLYTSAAVLVSWAERTMGAFFTRTTIQLVSEAKDWRPIGDAITLMHLFAGCVLALSLCLLATPLAALMGDPMIAEYLRLFALDVPLLALVSAHKYILIGIGRFRQRAISSAGRFCMRPVLIVVLVELGLSVNGAILGSIGATLVELAICRYYIRPSLTSGARLPVRRFMEYSLPLFLFGMSMQLYGRLDIFSLMVLGSSAKVVGIYAAAQNLSIIPPGILVISLPPLFLSTLNRLLIENQLQSAKEMTRQAMRAIIALLPFFAISAGAAKEIVVLVYGPDYSSAALLLAILAFGAAAVLFVSVSSAALIAGGKVRWVLTLMGPLVVLPAIGYLFVIPLLGPIGASLVTTLCSILSALTTVFAVHLLWGILPSGMTLMRSLIVSGAVFALTALWPAPGLLLLAKLSASILAIPILYLLMGETSVREMAAALRLVSPRVVLGRHGGGVVAG